MRRGPMPDLQSECGESENLILHGSVVTDGALPMGVFGQSIHKTMAMHQPPIIRLFVAILVTGLSATTVVMLRSGPSQNSAGWQREGLWALKIKKKYCSKPGHNCNETFCCQESGVQCFIKDRAWAVCKKDCVPGGPDPVDRDPLPWKCQALGPRTPGYYVPPHVPKLQPWVHINCSKSSENCLETRCCRDAGLACFKKNSSWAHCKTVCTDGPDPTDSDHLPWKCEQLGGRTPGVAQAAPKTAEWVLTFCAKKNESCLTRRCCRDPGHTCFQKESNFAQCHHTCAKGVHLQDADSWKNWTCKQLGGRTPGHVVLVPKPQKLAPWVRDHCADIHENCAHSRCCKNEKFQCFEQQPGRAQCLYKCLANNTKFAHHHQCAMESKGNTSEKCKYGGKTWTCHELGPRTLPLWGWPSLFCVHVMRLHSYESAIVKLQLQQDEHFRGGIFACDQYAVYSSDSPKGTLLGAGPYGPVRTHWFQSARVGRSSDHTAGNTLLFMNFWEAIRWDLQYKCCHWTIKADPDAVLLPDRMRGALSHRMGWVNFITTCDKYHLKDGPKMYGAAEAMSTQGLERYFENEYACRSMPWQRWGEDTWMGNCLKVLGVGPVFDRGFVGDNRCYGADCRNGRNSAYHPFKDSNAWMACYRAAMRS